MTTHFVVNMDSLDMLIKLSAAMFCGMLIGTERIISHKAAGMRTYALVSMTAALFVIIGAEAMEMYASQGMHGFDPFHIVSAIISGIGFMGAGVIIFRDTSVTGLTTASGLWAAAGIGMACGYGLYVPAFMATLLSLFIFVVLWHVEQRVKKYSFVQQQEEQPKK